MARRTDPFPALPRLIAAWLLALALLAADRGPTQAEDGGALWIHTRSAGVVALTYADLAQAGVPLPLPVDHLSLAYLGEPVPLGWDDRDGDGAFSPADRLYFYAAPYVGRYQDFNVYRLAWNQAPRLPMPRRAVAPHPAPGVSSVVTRTLRLAFAAEYRPTYQRLPGEDLWFDRALGVHADAPVMSRTYTVTLTAPAPDRVAHLTVRLHGGTTQHTDGRPDQAVRIHWNQTESVTLRWSGRRPFTQTLVLPGPALQDGPNHLVLTVAQALLPELSGYWISPDWLQLDYPSQALAVDNRLDGWSDGDALVATRFTDEEVWAFDITDPGHPTRLLLPPSTATDDGWQVAFREASGLPAGPRHYLLLGGTALQPPLRLVPDRPSAWRTADHAADYIAIVHPDLWDAIDPLLAHRADEGLRVVKVDVQDIYDEFAHGRVDPEAIRAFLTYAYQHWNAGEAPPRYVLLVGDGHYDFTGVSGTRLANLIPPYLASVDPWLGETAVDGRYAIPQGDPGPLPAMHIGRIPAQTPAQVTAVVNKILAYENQPAGRPWQRRVVLAADNNQDPAYAFQDALDVRWARLAHPGLDVTRLYYTPGGQGLTTPQAMREALREAFDGGALVIQWFGHASRFRWGSDSLWNVLDVDALQPNTVWPITLAYTCWSGYFINLYQDLQSLGETLVLAPERGAVAALSPTGLHVGGPLADLQEAVLAAIFLRGMDRLGPAVDAGKADFLARHPAWPDLVETMVLLGDPALRLPVPPPPQRVYLPQVQAAIP